MIETVVHTIGSLINGTPLEEPLDRAYYDFMGPRRTQATLGGITAQFNARSSSEYYSVQDFGGEKALVEEMLDALQPSDVLWDIGAFVGWHAAFFGQVAETVAFEADPDTFCKLQETATLNPVARITPVCLGLGNPSAHRERVSIAAGEGGGITDRGSDGKPTTVARPETLITTALSPPTAVKLDVQGLEGEVIEGFGDYLMDIQLLFVEFHEGRMTGDWTVETLHDRITEAGLEQQREMTRREDILKLYRRP
ncbi:MAG: FkbM family methyltransferase [Halodesulfurarchaeum sp.]|nr:FkbM family methyltransferase [Halodesulfurarchaeum sp.]